MKEIKYKVFVEPWDNELDGMEDPDGFVKELTLTEQDVRFAIANYVNGDSTEEDVLETLDDWLRDNQYEDVDAPYDYHENYSVDYVDLEEQAKVDGFIKEIVKEYNFGEHTSDPDGKIYVLHLDTEVKLFKTVAGMRKFVEDFEHDADEQTELKIVHDATQQTFRCYEYDANVEKDCCVDIWCYDLCEIND